MAYQPKSYRKFLATTAAAAMVATVAAPFAPASVDAASNQFSDVKSGAWYVKGIDYLVEKGALNGYEDGTFKPNNGITRAEVAKVLVEALGLETESNPKLNFSDTKNDAWYAPYVAALVAEGVIEGNPDGTFQPNAQITRAALAKMVVEAYDLEAGSANLSFPDLVPGAWYVDYIKTLASNGIVEGKTNGKFEPNATVTRAEAATFVHRTEVPSERVGGETVTGAVKVINNTTIEVTLSKAVSEVKASDFSIEGLEVTNAAVKQSDNRVVVLTTAAQESGKSYTVKYNGATVGTFTGVAAVIPESIKLETTSIQGVVGEQVTLKADIGQQTANVPVTFNVNGDRNNLNKDIVEEVLTDANGIATFTYTQYNADSVDHVFVYPTGAPAKRDQGYVYWGVKQILTLQADDDKGNALNNGESKVYKVTYLNPKDGTPMQNHKLKVTLAENVNVMIDKTSTATVNGVNPKQLSNSDEPTTVEITTDSKGQATFTVSGTNTKATPLVFRDDVQRNANQGNNKVDADELQVRAEQLTFGAEQLNHEITITRDGGEEAATGDRNGRKYKVVVKTKDGKAANGEIVNVALNEDIDRNISTNTTAVIRDHADDPADYAGEILSGVNSNQVSIKLNSKGEGEFRITSGKDDDYATPVVWIDINSSDAKDGNLDEGEPFKIADKTYFAPAKLDAGHVRAYKDAALTTRVKSDKSFKASETAYFAYEATNQSGVKYNPSNLPLKASFTVYNTGTNDVEVLDGAEWKTISPNRPLTVTPASTVTPTIQVRVKDSAKTSTVKVEATATVDAQGDKQNGKYLGKYEEKAKFQASAEVGTEYTGAVNAIDTANETITFDGKLPIKYKDAEEFEYNNTGLTKGEFERLVTGSITNTSKPIVKAFKDGDADKYTKFVIVSLTGGENLVNVDPVVISDAEFTNAANNNQVRSITLGDNITLVAPVAVTRAIDINLGGKTLTGDITVDHTDTGNSSLTNGTLDGDLTVDTPNASFTNNATVTGTVTIEDIVAGTFTNNGQIKGKVVINDTNGATFTNTGTVTGDVEVATDAPVTLKGTNLKVLISNANADVTVPESATVTIAPGIPTANIKITKGDKVITPGLSDQELVNAEALKFTSTSVKVAEDGKTLTLPQVSNGYTVAIVSSSKETVIDLDGKVTQQAQAETVALKFKVTKAGTTISATADVNVVVPAATQQPAPSTDASITGITVGGEIATLDPASGEYNVELPQGTVLADLEATDVVATANDTKATVGIPSMTNNGATWTVEVTAEDGTTKVTYTINVTVA